MKTLYQLFQSFEIGIRSAKSEKPREYIKSIGLDYTDLRIGFNSGQFHHGKSDEIKEHYAALGLLTANGTAVRDKSKVAYTSFGNYGLIFPLMDNDNTIVNYYALRFDLAAPKEEYLNEKGLYPCFPHASTKRLFIVPTIIDAASLLQSKALDQREAVLALHNGELLQQHREAIEALTALEEIIIINY